MSTTPSPGPHLRIADLWRYPVKSMQGERLDRAELGPAGIVGDRRWALRERASGLTLTARRAPELLFAHARLTGDGGVEIELPDGTVTADDEALSAWLGRDVELCDATTGEGAATYEIALDDDGAPGEHTEWFQWQGPTWSFHDSTRTQVSLVSTATIGAWDRRRFRANVILDDAEDVGAETAWIGRSITAGTATLSVTKPVDRCVMVTRPQPGGIERDLEVLRTIARDRGNELAIGALVTAPGSVAISDTIGPESG